MSFDEWFEQWESPPSWLFCKDDFEGAARAAWDAALKEKEEENKPSVTQAVADAQRYRWLRDVGDKTWTPLRARYCRGPASVDADIDEAMRQGAQHE
jgi:hypothetical protein